MFFGHALDPTRGIKACSLSHVHKHCRTNRVQHRRRVQHVPLVQYMYDIDHVGDCVFVLGHTAHHEQKGWLGRGQDDFIHTVHSALLHFGEPAQRKGSGPGAVAAGERPVQGVAWVPLLNTRLEAVS